MLVDYAEIIVAVFRNAVTYCPNKFGLAAQQTARFISYNATQHADPCVWFNDSSYSFVF